MTDNADNVIDFGKARLRTKAAKARAADPGPMPALKGTSHEDICEWIKEYMGRDEKPESEDPERDGQS